MTILKILQKLYKLITGSSILWKLIRNYAVLSEACGGIENVIKNMTDQGRALPDRDEAMILVKCISNILKTGVIDIPGVDEYELALNLDMINSNMSLGVEDLKSGKYFEIPVPKKG